MNITSNGLLSRRRLLQAAGGASLAPLAAWSQGRGRVVLPTAVSLPEELAAANRAGLPLVVLVSLDGCPFCREARDSHLGPLRDEQRQPVVQVDMRSAALVRDFSGRQVSHDALIKSWSINVAPTVLFFGPGGREIAPRLVGGYLPDFYGAYLDERLTLARRALQR